MHGGSRLGGEERRIEPRSVSPSRSFRRRPPTYFAPSFFTPQNKGSVAFRKYISGMLDLLLPDGNVVDHYGDEEFVFLGPDEGTADFMDWCALILICLHSTLA